MSNSIFYKKSKVYEKKWNIQQFLEAKKIIKKFEK